MLRRVAFACLLISTAAHADDAETGASQIMAPPSVTVPLPPPDVDAVPPAPPPPQNEPWSNVSHINGVPVPVGERNRYLYDYKKTNLSMNPIGLMLGYYEVDVAHALSPNLALSVELALTSLPHSDETDTQVAVSLPIYFKRTFNGPYLEPGLVVRNESNSDGECDGCTTSATYVELEMMIGWSWMFDSGLNMSAAVGVAKRGSNSNNGDYEDNTDDLSPAGYFRAGYAF